MTPQQRAVMQQAFDAWINKCHPNGKSLADVFEPAFGMIAENAWADAWGAALAQRQGDAAMPVIGAYAKPLVRMEDAQAALAAKDAEIARLSAQLCAPRGTDAQILKERELTASAISGAMTYGHNGWASPPDEAAWLRPFYSWGQEIAALTAERDALLKDAERLDWLARHIDGKALRKSGVVWPAWSEKNARDAIDAAMAQAAQS